MIGIYNDNFLGYLESYLGPVKTNPRNIITACPWCDINKPDRGKNHLWISVESPMFHCFRAGCDKSGSTWSLIRSLSGQEGDLFIDKEKIQATIKQKVNFTRNVVKSKDIELPDLNIDLFKLKYMYLKNRLKYNDISMSLIKGLIFDSNRFIEMNNITIDPRLARVKDYLHSNFIGFLSENKSVAVFRNIDPKASFRYFKLNIQPTKFLDYYKLKGYNINSNNIVLSEGIFDIFGEYIFDSLEIKKDCYMYASGLSTSYPALIKSICYHEQIFQPNIHILSDSNVGLKYYRNIKKYNSHLINTLTIYYNRMGHDFNDTPLIIEKFIL